MAQVDGSLADPTPVSRLADRADIYRIATALLRGNGLLDSAEPDDVLRLTEWLAGDEF